ncbi:hypothetical protein PFDG_05370, partial [Plasmodium falciparum Dd2]
MILFLTNNTATWTNCIFLRRSFSEGSKESTYTNNSKRDMITCMDTHHINQINYMSSNQMNNTQSNRIVLHFNSSRIGCICVNP